MNQFSAELQPIALSLVNLITAWGLKVIGAIVVLLIGRIIAGWARKLVRRMLEGVKVDPTLVPFLASVAYYLVMAMVVIASLSMAGIPTTSLVAVFGATGLAVALAMQGTLSNISAGVMLLVYRPFKVGDYVEAGGTAGNVSAISLFYTLLTTPDNIQITVPNSVIYGSTVTNYSANDTRRGDIVVGISYDDDIAVAVKTIDDLLSGDARVLRDPEPVVAVSALGDSSVDILVRYWSKRGDYGGLRLDMMRALKEGVEAAGCSFRFPQRDVHLYQVSNAS